MLKSGWGLFANRHRPSLGRAALSMNGERLALWVDGKPGHAARVACRALGSAQESDTALAELVQALGAKQHACEWLLDPGQYSLVQVERPPVPAEEWVAALRWKVRDLIGFPVEEAVMDAFEIPGLETRGRPPGLYLAVARKDELRPGIQRIREAGLDLLRIGIADLAWASAARTMTPGEDSLAVLVLDLRGGSMLILRDESLFVVRRFEFDASEQRALRDAPAAALGSRWIERVALELQRTLDYFDRTHQRPPPGRLLLLTAIGQGPPLAEGLRQLLGLEVLLADPARHWPELEGSDDATRAGLVGLAACLQGDGR